MSDNMKLWESVEKTDPAITKKVAYGQRKFTTVCAQAQIKRATELWGPMGHLWGVENESFNIITDRVCVYQATLHYVDEERCTLPIHSDIAIIKRDKNGDNKYQDDWAKKVATDALTKGLSKLGFNSDIFEGKFDDNKYVAQMKEEFAKPADKPAPKPKVGFTPETEGLNTPLMLNMELLEHLREEIRRREIDVGKLHSMLATKYGLSISHGAVALGELMVEQYNKVMPQILAKPLKP